MLFDRTSIEVLVDAFRSKSSDQTLLNVRIKTLLIEQIFQAPRTNSLSEEHAGYREKLLLSFKKFLKKFWKRKKFKQT